MKAYLPVKYNPNWDELKQRWVATGLKAEKANIKQVEKLARKLHYVRVTQNFIWDNWLSTEEELKPENKSLKLSDIYGRFKADYFKKIRKKLEQQKMAQQLLKTREKIYQLEIGKLLELTESPFDN